MLKTRIIPSLLFKEIGLIKDKQFNRERRLGPLLQAVKVYNLRQVDELVILDIAATLKNAKTNFSIFQSVVSSCSVPLTLGGGIKTIKDVKKALRSGADKVLINSALYENTELASEIENIFGKQCLVAGIDVMKKGESFTCVSHCGQKEQDIDPVTWAKKLEKAGAGEIFLVNIKNDGMMKGYDLNLIKKISDAVSIPVIASGGCGSYHDMHLALKNGANAISASSIFQFTEKTPLEAKDYLRSLGHEVRIPVDSML